MMKRNSLIVLGLSFTFLLAGCGPSHIDASSTSPILPDSSLPHSSIPDNPPSSIPVIEGYEYVDTRIDYEKDEENAIVYSTTPFSPVDAIHYYESVEGKKGNELKKALYELIRGHTIIKYDGTSGNNWKTIYRSLDSDPDNEEQMLLIYTGMMPKETQFDREHIWPKSNGFTDYKNLEPGIDLFNLHPALPGVNSYRNDSQYDDLPDTNVNPYYHFHYSKMVFEPEDSTKGDIARTLFYMAVRYEGYEKVNGTLKLLPDLELYPETNHPADGNTYYMGNVETLLEWNRLDPVDKTEIARNEKIYQNYQYNRNPFIDHPEYADLIFNAKYQDVAATIHAPTSSREDLPSSNHAGPSTLMEGERTHQYVFTDSLSGLGNSYSKNHNIHFTTTDGSSFFASTCYKSGSFTLGNNGKDGHIDTIEEKFYRVLPLVDETTNASLLSMDFDVTNQHSVLFYISDYSPAASPNWIDKFHGWYLLASYDQGETYELLTSGTLLDIDYYRIYHKGTAHDTTRYALVITGEHPRLDITKIETYA